MKNKKIKKLDKQIDKLTSLIEGKLTPVKSMEEETYSEYDREVSDKIKKMVLNLIKYKDTVNINIHSDVISLSVGDLGNLKKSVSRKNYSEDNFLELTIIKDKGFRINYGYRSMSKYNDINLYNELIDIVKNRVKEINAENFNDLW